MEEPAHRRCGPPPEGRLGRCRKKVDPYTWVFPKIGVPQMDGLYIMENLIKMDGLGGKPTIFGNTHIIIRWWIQILFIFNPKTWGNAGNDPF